MYIDININFESNVFEDEKHTDNDCAFSNIDVFNMCNKIRPILSI